MKFALRMAATFATVLSLTAMSSQVLAHSDDPHPDTLKATQGGQLGVAGAFSYELVIDKNAKEGSESAVVVYVTDHAGKKVQTTGASGTATILAGKLKASALLKPDGDNRMKGSANYAASPNMKVLVSITLAGKPPEQTRFTPLAVAKDGHTVNQQ
ncbi:MAG: hypothetical protein K9K38_21785 [Rhodoferax sp.]|nr:hypothetical protein [Rhodoferax sp.]